MSRTSSHCQEAAAPRLMGEEYELRPNERYAFDATCINALRDSGLIVVRSLPPNVSEGQHARHAWLDNGYRFHNEVGQHLEVAGWERLGPLDTTMGGLGALATAKHMAGLAAVKDAFPQLTIHFNAGNYYTQVGWPPEYASRSVQLNLLTSEEALARNKELGMAPILSSHWATATWAGAGLLAPDGFQLFQRTQDKDGRFLRVHRNDDIVDGGSVRIERRVGEANRSVFVNFAQYASASVLGRVVEHEDLFSAAENEALLGSMPKFPYGVMQAASKDLTFKETFVCVDGNKRTALDIQRILLARGQALSQRIELPEDEVLGLKCWEKLLDIMDRTRPLQGDIKEAALIMHWAVRMSHLMRHAIEDDIASDSVVLWTANNRRLNIQSLGLDRIHPVDPLAKFAKRTARGIVDKELVTAVPQEPSQHTRGRARTEIMRLAHAGNTSSIKKIFWRCVWLNDGRRIDLDPLQTELPPSVAAEKEPARAA